jgi:peptidoglycan/xylan/chitin deacetylase (PgdA/CDA1 family)
VQTTAPEPSVPLPSGLSTAPQPSTDPSASSTEPSTLATEEEACSVPARFVGKDLERLPVTDKVVALTFDAGANADAVRPILDTLAARDVPGTFYLTGSFVQTFPGRSARIARNHLVGNHTMNHLDLTTLGDLRVRRQIRRAETAILETTGEDPRRFFRFPFGARDARTIGLANELCYVPFRWTVDTLGWKGTSGGMTEAKVVQRVLDAAAPGAIVLMHVGSNPDDGSTLDADALPLVIRELRERGYGFARLSRVLAPAP